jgi:hypothetical protein
VDDEISGLPPEPSPAEVVEAVEDITAQVTGADVLASDAAGTTAAAPGAADQVDVLTPDGQVATVEATVTDEGVAAPEAAPEAEPVDEGRTSEIPAPVNDAPATAPVEGYDDWSIAQLRGRLRGYQAVTVTGLIEYEEANRARAPYLTMLRNRLQKLDEQAVEASPLAPRGA